MSTTDRSTHRSHRWLRPTLALNATTSFASGLAAFLAPAALGAWIGLEPALMTSLGIELMAFAVGVAFLATRPDLGRPWARRAVLAVAVLDVLWVVASAAALALPLADFTTAGRWVVALQALAVADFAAVQLWSWRGLRADAPMALPATS